MRIFIILAGIFLYINKLNATSSILMESDKSSNNEDENNVVFVFKMYAVKNTNLKAVTEVLSQTSSDQLPSTFEPLGNVLLLHEKCNEITPLKEFSELYGNDKISLTKIDTEKESNIFELKLNQEDNKIMSFDEFFELIDDENLMLYVNIDGNKIKVTLDEELTSPEDQPFTANKFLDFIENEGYLIHKVKIQAESITVGFSMEVSKKEGAGKLDESDQEPKITNIENEEDKINEIGSREEEKIDKKEDKIKENSLTEKKIDEIEKNNDWFVTLDHLTKEDLISKIRRRQSIYQECKLDKFFEDLAIKYKKKG